MTLEIKTVIKNWQFHRGLSSDILKSLNDSQLALTVGKNMGTIGEQFRHMVRVQIQYTEAIKNQKIGRTEYQIDSDVAKSKEKLLALLEMADKNMLNILEELSDEQAANLAIDWKYWGVDSMNLSSHLDALLDHENLHNGQLIVYLKTHEIPFPKSWESWGL